MTQTLLNGISNFNFLEVIVLILMEIIQLNGLGNVTVIFSCIKFLIFTRHI
jgi:hypothetical protein